MFIPILVVGLLTAFVGYKVTGNDWVITVVMAVTLILALQFRAEVWL